MFPNLGMIAAFRKLLVRVLQAPVHVYRLVISPVLPPRCRHVPSCSAYALQALERHGPVRGTRLALRRVVRCHPLNPGGEDPVPPRRG